MEKFSHLESRSDNFFLLFFFMKLELDIFQERTLCRAGLPQKDCIHWSVLGRSVVKLLYTEVVERIIKILTAKLKPWLNLKIYFCSWKKRHRECRQSQPRSFVLEAHCCYAGSCQVSWLLRGDMKKSCQCAVIPPLLHLPKCL